MTREEVQTTLQRLTMPNWLFITWAVFPHPDGYRINATMIVPDRNTGDPVSINYNRDILALDEDDVLDGGRKLLYYLAMHEVNEHLHLDGKQWVDSHEEGDPFDYEEMMERQTP